MPSIRHKMNLLNNGTLNDIKPWAKPWHTDELQNEELLESPAADDLINFITKDDPEQKQEPSTSSHHDEDSQNTIVENETEVPTLETCRKNLTNHIRHMQEQIYERLELIETKVKVLESEYGYDGENAQEEFVDVAKLKDSVKEMMADLNVADKMTYIQ